MGTATPALIISGGRSTVPVSTQGGERKRLSLQNIVSAASYGSIVGNVVKAQSFDEVKIKEADKIIL